MRFASNVPISKSTGVAGWHTIAEENNMIQLAGKVPANGTIVELGTEYGRSACEFAHGSSNDVKIYSVDQFPRDHHAVGDLFLAWAENILEAGYAKRITSIEGMTHTIGAGWPYGEIDLLFVDAGHSYNEVKRDIAHWVAHIKAGGVMVFHDYAKHPNAHYSHFEVKQAVDEWHTDNPLWERVNGADSIVWFIKPAKKMNYIPVTEETLRTDVPSYVAPEPVIVEELSEPKETITAQQGAELLDTSVRLFKNKFKAVGKRGRVNLYDKASVTEWADIDNG